MFRLSFSCYSVESFSKSLHDKCLISRKFWIKLEMLSADRSFSGDSCLSGNGILLASLSVWIRSKHNGCAKLLVNSVLRLDSGGLKFIR